jgi:hypothetical protein
MERLAWDKLSASKNSNFLLNAFFISSTPLKNWISVSSVRCHFPAKRRLNSQHDNIQHNDTQHNDIQHSDIQHNDFQHDDIQHNDIQHNEI